MIQAFACAKVNLSLRVAAARSDGLHPLAGRFQSILWLDRLELNDADLDTLESDRGTEVVDGWQNLAWRAVNLVRERAGVHHPLQLVLTKHIPMEAGLGGGSADAAAGLGAAGNRFGLSYAQLADLAPALGSDVPFCLAGGSADVRGVGDRIDARSASGDYALGLVVPPISVATAAVYRRWDELEGPTGFAVDGPDVPPELRAVGPLRNDLYPAAAAVEPSIEDWRSELANRWSRPVMMTGSGPTLFAFFADPEEADEALRVVPAGARAATAAVPVPFGWAVRLEDGPLVSRGARLDASWVNRIEARAAFDAASPLDPSTIEPPSD